MKILMIKIKTVKKLDKQTLQYLMKIGADGFARTYIDKAYLLPYMEDTNSFILIYEEDEKILAFSACSIWNSQELLAYYSEHIEIFKEHNITEESSLKLGMIKTIAVDIDFRKKGIGKKLFEESEKKLIDMGIETLCVPAWIYNSFTPMGRILHQLNYKFWFQLKQPWLYACKDNINFCPHRKDNLECICDSDFYIKGKPCKQN